MVHIIASCGILIFHSLDVFNDHRCSGTEGGIKEEVLSPEVRRAMAEFAWRELYVPEAGWVRSLSTQDALYSPHNLLVMRATQGWMKDI